MFKNRLFLYGLGLGLIVGAVLLQLMLKVDQFENGSPDPASAATAEQLQAWADKLNYKLYPKEQTIYTEKDLETIRAKIAEEERTKLAAQAPGSLPQAPAKTVHSIYISERMEAYNVADMLVKAGMFTDASQFISALAQKKMTTRIRAGSYTFEGPVTIDDIIAKITIASP
ncbi:hypothetical protein [Paenibacillus ginsengarvi]|uniref:Endolytic transglycosylase MltG n=1 Tax=Paenibacillus ginsengarvi TaxID=400777 RepID=A0A3B0CM69_9BACL|nr:hypothetical protein [Paenibacillus ginsengarvi]RKN86493.1 hypothetical protein D7M11_00540 [Paenibacillus ginsengarvi]